MADKNHPNAPVGATATCPCGGSGCKTCGGSGLVPDWYYTINDK